MNVKVQEPFIWVELPNQSKGLLKVEGQHDFKVNVWTLPGADFSDNENLFQSIKSAYEQYYHRVKEYTEVK